MKIEPFDVLIQKDKNDCVIAINSSAFVKEDDWIKIDAGYEDKYHHAQSNYLPKPLIDTRGVYQYKFTGEQVVERTQEEMDADYIVLSKKTTIKQRVEALETTTDDIILMMADIIGGE